MNVRTNLRNWRNDATYIIVVQTVGKKTSKPYIHARLEAISATYYSTKSLCKQIESFPSENSKVYVIGHDRSHGITSPQRAVEEAVRRYKAGE